MRDPETVYAALTAAETGHLLLSTVHTTNVPETINRIVDFFPPHQHQQVRVSLSSSLKGIIAERLLPRADGTGRVPAFEICVSTGRIQQAILDPEQTADITQIIADGEYYGMQTFDQTLAKMLRDNIITLDEAMRSADNPHDLKVILETMGLIQTGSNRMVRQVVA